MVSSVYKTNQCLKKTLNAVTEIPRNTAQAATILLIALLLPRSEDDEGEMAPSVHTGDLLCHHSHRVAGGMLVKKQARGHSHPQAVETRKEP